MIKKHGEIVTQSKMATILGVNEKHIRNLIAKGMPLLEKGRQGVAAKIDTSDAINWLVNIAVLKKTSAMSASAIDVSETTSLDDLLTLQRIRKLEIENDKLESKVVPIDAVDAVLQKSFATLKSTMDGAAGRMCQGDAVLRLRLLDEHRSILDQYATQLAAFNCEDFEAPESSFKDDSPATEKGTVAVEQNQDAA